MSQRPQELLVPLLAILIRFHIGERSRDALVRVVHRFVDRGAVFGGETVFLIPNVDRRFLIRNAAYISGLDFDHRVHG